MGKPTLYILCGLPFSGKTILTEQLVKRLGLVKVSIDDIKFAYGFDWSENEHMSDEEWKRIFDESYGRILAFLEQGKDVIYDSANHDRASRDRLRTLAAKGNFPTKVIHVDTPIEIIRDRWSENQATKERFHLPQRFLQAALDTYEKPTKDENVIAYTQSMSFDEWVKENFPRTK